MNNNIQNRASFDFIRYANCWEDPELLLKSMPIKKGLNCISIASAGDNSFSLLTKNPQSVIAIDLSKVQLACVELKKIAFAELKYEQMLCFLGFLESDNRKKTYYSLKKYLSSAAKTYFDENLQLIVNGIIHQGKFENYFHIFKKYILPLVHNRKRINLLLEEKNEDKRIEFFNKSWNSIRWKMLFKLFFNRWVMGKFGRDKEFFKYVDNYTISKDLAKKVEYAITKLPTHTNPYLRYILTGNFGNTLPHYAKKENYTKIRNNLDKLEIQFGGITDILENYTEKKQFDFFNLSDIFEYMNDKLFLSISEKIIQHTAHKGRIAYWNMMLHRRISEILPEKCCYLKKLSENQFLEDKAFFYKSYFVEEIIK